VATVRIFSDSARSRDFLHTYQMCDNCGNKVSSELVIPVVYTAGLDGVRNSLYEVRGAVQFTAYQFVNWTEREQRGVTMTPNTTNTVPYGGNADGRPVFRYYNNTNASVMVDHITNTTTGHAIFFGTLASPGISVAPGESLQVSATDRSFSAIKNPGGIDARANVDFTRSSPRLFRLIPGDNTFDLVTNGGGEYTLRWSNQYRSADSVRISEYCEDCSS
jgi:hypothetical protein